MNDLPPFIALTISGALGAIANVALGDKTVALPRIEGHRIRLGFLGQLLLCIGVAHAVDHDFQTSFFASLCGAAMLRHIKRQIERVFGEAVKQLDDDPK